MWIAGRGRRRPAMAGGGATGGIWSLVGDGMKRTKPSRYDYRRHTAALCGSLVVQKGGLSPCGQASAGGWRLIR